MRDRARTPRASAPIAALLAWGMLAAPGTSRSAPAPFVEVLVSSRIASGSDLASPRMFAMRSVRPALAASPARVRGELVVTSFDASGRRVHATSVADPHALRAELPDATGLLHAIVTVRSDAAFTVVIPGGASTLAFAREGVALGSVAVPSSSGPAPPAAPAQEIAHTGDPANRMDIVVVSEGYTAGELPKFAADASAFIAGMFDQEPYREYRGFFNVHRLDVASAESGADHPERASFVDTAFDATYWCSGIDRLICVDTGKVFAAVGAAFSAAESDAVIVLVNDPQYGGSGGELAVASTHEQAVELVLHEFGHSFGLLGDEYDDPWITCNPIVEPDAPNVTTQFLRENVKWRHWIDPATPVPTLGSSQSVPGAYSGAAYCPAGLWRPTYNSKMRSLGRPFDQINTEQLVRRTYAYVRPIDASSPPGAGVVLARTASLVFSITTPKPATHSLDVRWTLDGSPYAAGPAITFAASAVAPGSHTLAAIVSDPTPAVRLDPEGALAQTRTWSVTVMAS